jgi:hypothetical protein
MNTRWIRIHTPVGIYLGDLAAMPSDARRLRRALSLITRGLFAHYHHKRLAAHASFDIGRIDPILLAQNWQDLFCPG